MAGVYVPAFHRRQSVSAMMGRVCPAPCQDGCNRNDVDDFVGINAVEQFIGDNAIVKAINSRRVRRPEKSCRDRRWARGHGSSIPASAERPYGHPV